MTQTSPTFSQIKALVQTIRKKNVDGRVVGVSTKGRWSGERFQKDGSETYEILQCDSPLAMRIALQGARTADCTVILTGLPQGSLESDILLRLAKRRLIPIRAWDIVRSQFQARAVDPRLWPHEWMADLLLEHVNAVDHPQVPSGVLDAETAWGLLLDRVLGLPAAQTDLVTLLNWSLSQENVERWCQADERFRTAAGKWIAETAGSATAPVLESLFLARSSMAVPVGLALAVIFHSEAQGKLEKAQGKLEEKYLGGTNLTAPTAERWSKAALEVVRGLQEPKGKLGWLERGDEILSGVGGEAFAHLSPVSRLGFRQRLARYGDELRHTAVRVPVSVAPTLRDLHRAVLSHDLAQDPVRTRERVDMSLRLAQWLAHSAQRASEKSERSARSFAEAARLYAGEGGFVDWARRVLSGAESVRELAEAYSKLREEVSIARERANEEFARLLADWTRAGSTGGEVVLLERVLEEVVAPLADEAPVLVVVLDGMSFSVLRELLEDVLRSDWVEIVPAADGTTEPGRARPAIAPFPSVTEVCRASLLSGKLYQGGSDAEARGFAENAALKSRSPKSPPPVLFHKSALDSTRDPALLGAVLEKIASKTQKFVGVVINAIDDFLHKGDQLDLRWEQGLIRVLEPLLSEARQAGRIVALLSDHGHVLDHGSDQHSGQESDRWRADDGTPRAGEIQISGPRVVMPASHKLIAPWSERVRYGAKKNGYHGGVSPQEVVVPVALIRGSNADQKSGLYAELAPFYPAWWDLSLPADSGAQARVKSPPTTPETKTKRTKKASVIEAELVTVPPSVSPAARSAEVKSIEVWVQRLFSSPIFEEQKALGGRNLPSNERVEVFLKALAERGGKLTVAALAQRIDEPIARLPGLLATFQRLLNIEGYGILTKDEEADTVELNRELLFKQFAIE